MTVLVTRECRTPEIKPLHKEKYTEFKRERHGEEEQRWIRGPVTHIFCLKALHYTESTMKKKW